MHHNIPKGAVDQASHSSLDVQQLLSTIVITDVSEQERRICTLMLQKLKLSLDTINFVLSVDDTVAPNVLISLLSFNELKLCHCV